MFEEVEAFAFSLMVVIFDEEWRFVFFECRGSAVRGVNKRREKRKRKREVGREGGKSDGRKVNRRRNENWGGDCKGGNFMRSKESFLLTCFAFFFASCHAVARNKDPQLGTSMRTDDDQKVRPRVLAK